MFKDISPSKMPRIVNCPGSVNLCKRFPSLLNDSNDGARQGSLAHWLAKQNLSNGLGLWRFLDKNPINDQIVDREMIANISNYCNIIRNVGTYGSNSDTTIGGVEKRYEIKTGKFSGFGGTPDFIFYNNAIGKLTIIDLKYGFTSVKVSKNWQLLSYVWLFSKVFPKLSIKLIEFGVYQPRAVLQDNIYSTWKPTFTSLQRFYFPIIEKSLYDCQLLTSITKTGEHCYYCDAMPHCENNRKTCLKVIDLTQIQYGEEPTGEQLSDQLKLFKFGFGILKKRLQVIESVIEYKLEKGEHIPGYKLEFSNGRRYWDISDKKAKRIGIPRISKLMTPKQAEDYGFPQELIDKYVKIRKSVKLVEVNMDEINQSLGPSEDL